MDYENIAQRTAASYQKSLADFTFVAPEGCEVGQLAALEESERQLHEFFHAAYEKMVQRPELFGLPLGADDCVEDNQPERTKKLAEMNRKLRRTQGMIQRGLELLMAMGKDGRLEGQTLVLDLNELPDFAKQFKAAKKLLAGLETIGVRLSITDGRAALSSRQFPTMLPALSVLASACAWYSGVGIGMFHFARCDFKALTPDYTPAARDIFRVFDSTEQAYLSILHDFFTRLNYKPIYQIYGIFGWEVGYQGKRKIKSTPLAKIQYDERFRNHLRIQVKCASAGRLAPIIGKQSPALQEDFFSRANICQGDQCRWCDTRPQLGPSVVEYKGEQKTICWYVNSDVHGLDDRTVDLIQQYALMHESLN